MTLEIPNGDDTGHDADGEFGDGSSEGVVLPPLDDTPVCGNGVLDLGEECDDRNRLNGDGCDWLCRVGLGEPPPEPDPVVRDYEPVGEPATVGDAATTVLVDSPAADLPLVWTGTEFATAYHGGFLPREPGPVRFRRFDHAGRQIDAEWEYHEGAAPYDGHDLVWTGEGFGLFFIDEARGIVYLRLEGNGKPVGHPVVVEPDPGARAPAAAWTRAGHFILVWTVATDGVFFSICGGSDDGSSSVRAKRVNLDGTTGPTTTIATGVGPPLNVAAGDGGLGVVMGAPDSGSGGCAIRFLRLDHGLTAATSSGWLAGWFGIAMRSPVAWTGERFAVAWLMCPSCDAGEVNLQLCLAQFDGDGTLARAPVCNVLDVDVAFPGATGMAVGDGGFLVVVDSLLSAAEPRNVLRFARLDGTGCAVTTPTGVLASRPGGWSPLVPFDVAWSGDEFGVLWAASASEGVEHLALYFQMLRSVP